MEKIILWDWLKNKGTPHFELATSILFDTLLTVSIAIVLHYGTVVINSFHLLPENANLIKNFKWILHVGSYSFLGVFIIIDILKAIIKGYNEIRKEYKALRNMPEEES